MIAYIMRRLLYAIPILIGVNIITFGLFFLVNTPDDMARMQLGVKRVTPEAIANWKQERGYDKPLLFNASAAGSGKLWLLPCRLSWSVCLSTSPLRWCLRSFVPPPLISGAW